MRIPDYLICLLRNLYVGQEATGRTLYGTTDWFKIKKGVRQGYLLSPCLFNLYAEQIMRNVRLDELQAGIQIDGRNINNLRYVCVCVCVHARARVRACARVCACVHACTCVCVLVAQSCLILCNPIDCSLPGSSVHGILQNTGVVIHSLLQNCDSAIY